jgi:RNA polymerase primary sigma factor
VLNLIASGRSFVTEAHQTGADVRSLAEVLIAHARGAGGQITSAEVVQTVESAEVTPAQAKKILRALVDAGVTVVVDGSAPTRRRVAAARAATPASKATTAKATPAKKAAAAPKQVISEAVAPDEEGAGPQDGEGRFGQGGGRGAGRRVGDRRAGVGRPGGTGGAG